MTLRSNMASIRRAVDSGLAIQEAELAEARQRQLLAVVTRTATGFGDLDQVFSLDRRFRLVFVRCHFTGSAGTAAFVFSLDSANGSAYDARLFTITQAGTNRDVHLRIGDGDEPSAWTFQTGDALRLRWTNPDSGNITWGLEVGLALAS